MRQDHAIISISLCALFAPDALAQKSVWPIPPSEEQAQRREDFNKDGVADIEVAWSEGGSGFRRSIRCVQDGRSGHRACSEWLSTPYSSFGGVRLVSEPPVRNRAIALVERPCLKSDPSSAKQASMWLLVSSKALARQKRGSARLNWQKGKPSKPSGACLSLRQAKKMRGGWWSLQDFEGRPSKDWRIYYTAKWYREGRERPLSVVAKGRGFKIFQHRHALAIYDEQRNRHAWFANYEGAKAIADGFKVDRWDTIKGVELSVQGMLKVRLSTMEDGRHLIAYQPADWLKQR